MKQKKAIAMSFNWIFALIVGGAILFLAIYGTTKLIDTGETQIYTETAAKIVTLLNPLGTGLADGKSYELNFQKETRTYYGCSSVGSFGNNKISFAEKTIGDKFGERGGEISTKKYVFAEDIVEGKTLSLFSKSFSMPFKIDDVIVISSKDYCFYQAPNEIKDELEGMVIKNINFADEFGELGNCSGVRVCFDSNIDCDVSVYGMCDNSTINGYNCESKYDYGKVIKKGGSLYYNEALIYGAIFSSPELYECNLERLVKRFVELGSIYLDKAKIIDIKGCSSNVGAELSGMVGLADNFESSENLFVLSQKADVMNSKNEVAVCKLW